MKIPRLIPTVWALLCSLITYGQHNEAPLSTNQVLIPLLFNTSSAHDHSIVIEKKHHHLSSATGFALNGDTLFTGGYKNGRLHGNWSSWYHPDHRCDSGKLVKSIPDGEWKSWYSNGRLRSIRTYSAYRYSRAQYEIPRKAGRATFVPLVDVARQDPVFANQVLTPVYSYGTLATNASSTRYPVPRNIEERVKQNTSGKAMPYLPPFSQCLHHGLYMNYYPDGSVKDSGYYKDGLRDGVWIEREEGEVVATGAYRRGYRYDTWRYSDESGRLLYIKWFRKGKEVGKREW